MEQRYIQHLEKCFQNAEHSISKLPISILEMEGMTGTKTRHFYNNLLNIEDARYLEIGTYKGSSMCSAMYGNKATVICIDNWSEFSGPRQECFANLNQYKGDNACTMICEDSFEIDVNELPQFNLYLYDGDHSTEAHTKALTYYINKMDDIFIFVVDDWSWEQVRLGTKKAIDELGLTVLWEKAIECQYLPETVEVAKKTWWNGMWAAVLSKKSR